MKYFGGQLAGKSSVRVNGGGAELPSPRLLHTLLLTSSAVSIDKSVTYVAVSWGQLISHDTARIIDQRPGQWDNHFFVPVID